jgi:hypothetical protein
VQGNKLVTANDRPERWIAPPNLVRKTTVSDGFSPGGGRHDLWDTSPVVLTCHWVSSIRASVVDMPFGVVPAIGQRGEPSCSEARRPVAER